MSPDAARALDALAAALRLLDQAPTGPALRTIRLEHVARRASDLADAMKMEETAR